MLMGDMMTREVPCLHPHDTLRQGVTVLRRNKLDALPVVDEEGYLIGIFTKSNVLDAFLAGVDLRETITGYFNPQVVTVEVNTPYEVIEQRAKHTSVGTGVVIDDERKVLGIFTKVDMILALFHEAEQLAGKLNAVYQAMPNGLIVVSQDRRLQRLNPAGEKILGIEQKFLKGSSLDCIFPGIDWDGIINHAKHHVGVHVQLNQVPVLCNISPIGASGETVIVFQALNDLDHIAEELEATKRLYETLLTVMNIAYEAIVVVDSQGKITLINEAACNFFGKKEKDIIHKPIEEVIENIRLRRTLKTGLAETNEIQVIQGKTCIVSRSPIVRQGKIIGAVGKIVYQKIEEAKDVAERLAQMDRELRLYKEKVGSIPTAVTFNQIVTLNPAMRRLKQEAVMAARGNSTILLTGASGTGKGLFAEAIHQASPRRKGPFVKVNCAAVPDNLLESEFFGYANGAFTGAQRGGKLGKFMLAHGGTLFLDEIGDMSLNLQSKLLRVLEDKSFEPIGSNESLNVDVRIIAATNQDLLKKVGLGEFRSDLFYRLNVINFHLISLRHRSEDVIPLVHVFLERLNQDFGKKIKGVSLAVQRVLHSHRWPGNVRELRNVLERAVNFAEGDFLEIEDLPFYLREETLETTADYEKGWNLEIAHHNLDKNTIKKALTETKGNKSEAARMLGISRSWLYEKIQRFDLK